MARKLRLFANDIPCHIIQRGNNKCPVFFTDRDRTIFLEIIYEAKRKHPCEIFSYCLMDNHFHLLINPKDKENPSLLMKFLGAKFVRYINKTQQRTGTLWEGRFRSSLIDEQLYFITCLRYIEMNPVRAGLVASPELCRWTSYRFRAYGEKNFILDLDPWYQSLSSDPEERQRQYRRFFATSLSDSELKLIRQATNKCSILGSAQWKERLENLLQQELIMRPPGRPVKMGSELFKKQF